MSIAFLMARSESPLAVALNLVVALTLAVVLALTVTLAAALTAAQAVPLAIPLVVALRAMRIARTVATTVVAYAIVVGVLINATNTLVGLSRSVLSSISRKNRAARQGRETKSCHQEHKNSHQNYTFSILCM